MASNEASKSLPYKLIERLSEELSDRVCSGCPTCNYNREHQDWQARALINEANEFASISPGAILDGAWNYAQSVPVSSVVSGLAASEQSYSAIQRALYHAYIAGAAGVGKKCSVARDTTPLAAPLSADLPPPYSLDVPSLRPINDDIAVTATIYTGNGTTLSARIEYATDGVGASDDDVVTFDEPTWDAEVAAALVAKVRELEQRAYDETHEVAKP